MLGLLPLFKDEVFRLQERWLCSLTCMSTRAVYLEVAFGLDTDSFIMLLHVLQVDEVCQRSWLAIAELTSLEPLKN